MSELWCARDRGEGSVRDSSGACGTTHCTGMHTVSRTRSYRDLDSACKPLNTAASLSLRYSHSVNGAFVGVQNC